VESGFENQWTEYWTGLASDAVVKSLSSFEAGKLTALDPLWPELTHFTLKSPLLGLQLDSNGLIVALAATGADIGARGLLCHLGGIQLIQLLLKPVDLLGEASLLVFGGTSNHTIRNTRLHNKTSSTLCTIRRCSLDKLETKNHCNSCFGFGSCTDCGIILVFHHVLSYRILKL
jgi:hypothetical protein